MFPFPRVKRVRGPFAVILLTGRQTLPVRCTFALSQGLAAIERAACLGVFGARCKTCACTVLLALSASEGGERLSIGVVLSYPLILLRIIPLLLPGSRAADGVCVTECEACTYPDGVGE